MEEDDLFHSQLLYNKINGKEIKIDRVEIEDSRKRVNSQIHIYIIRSHFNNQNIILERRFSDFVKLDEYLQMASQFEGIILPKLPDKQPVQSFIGQYISFMSINMDARKQELQMYLDHLVNNELFQRDKPIQAFLTKESMNEFNEQMIIENQILPKYQFYQYSDYYQYAKTYLKSFIEHRKEQVVNQQKLQSRMEKIGNTQMILESILTNINQLEKQNNRDSRNKEYQTEIITVLNNQRRLKLFQEQQDSCSVHLKQVIQNIKCALIAYQKLTKYIQQFSLEMNLLQNTKSENYQQMENQKQRVEIMDKKIKNIFENLTKETEKFEKGLQEMVENALVKLIQENLKMVELKVDYFQELDLIELLNRS